MWASLTLTEKFDDSAARILYISNTVLSRAVRAVGVRSTAIAGQIAAQDREFETIQLSKLVKPVSVGVMIPDRDLSLPLTEEFRARSNNARP